MSSEQSSSDGARIATRLLVLAGHDPSGGAGVDADRQAAGRAGVSVEAVISAWTDQDGVAVSAVRPRPVATIAGELAAALARGPGGMKTGLLPGAAHVQAMARCAVELRARTPGAPIVIDPVLAASGGEPFLDAEGVRALLACLPEVRPILTPNLPEAARLLAAAEGGAALDPGSELAASPEAALGAARRLIELGAGAVVLTGGHASGARARDLVLAAGADPVWIEQTRVAGPGIHGSGCRHAATLAAQLLRGLDLVTAARRAASYVALEIRAANAARESGEPA